MNQIQHPLIYKRMAAIMADIGPIAKDQKNAQQGFKYRGVDDIYNNVQEIMAKHGVISLPTVVSERTEERTTKTGSALIYRVLTIRYDFYAEDGSSVPSTVIGEGMDSGDKASNKAMSVADKYSLLQAFKIPTAEIKDPDAESHEVVSKANQRLTAQPPKTNAVSPAPRQETKAAETGTLPRHSDYVIPVGKHKGKALPDVRTDLLGEDSGWWAANGKTAPGKEYAQKAREFLADLQPGDEPF